MKPHADYYQSLTIDEKVFLKNVSLLQDYFQKPLGVVVKGHAYGHGLLEAAQLFVKAGVKRLICYHLSDAITLRERYSKISILLIGPVELSDLEDCAKLRIELTIWSLSFLKAVREYFDKSLPGHPTLGVHLEIETGMYRTGILPEEVWKERKDIFEHPRVQLVGFSTHLSGADEKENIDRVKAQVGVFRSFQGRIKDILPHRWQDLEWHGPNSAGLMLKNLDVFTHSRVGILAYGFFPSAYSRSLWPADSEAPTPALEWISSIAGYQEIPADKYTGYGQTHKTSEGTETVMIPTGYGDGFPRALSNNWCVEINGHPCPVIGRVNMNQIIADVSGREIPKSEKTVKLIQASGDFDWYWAAERSGRFIYESLTGISPKIIRHIVSPKGERLKEKG